MFEHLTLWHVGMSEGVNIDNEVLVTGLSWRVVKGSEYMKFQWAVNTHFDFMAEDSRNKTWSLVLLILYAKQEMPFDWFLCGNRRLHWKENFEYLCPSAMF